MRKLVILSAAATALAVAGPAWAQSIATTTTDLNVRAGPSSQEAVIGTIAGGSSVSIDTCVNAGRWCRVDLNGGSGWISSRFLSGDIASSGAVVSTETTGAITRPGSPGTTAGVVTGGAAGAVTGAVIGGPVGAAIGGAAGMVAGGATGAAIDPPVRVRSYVRTHRVEPLYLKQRVAVGATLPDTVELRPIPDYEYQYVYLNDRPVLVEPQSRRVVYVVR
ncbi:DUF1236 domain-containing protein [Mesorhizobium sp. BAC0120]|uniref:DUF1236 domain-containing protein n=1 Tax=Mesorhizobium sp. BAC0120 TaxID=3090670 RepID=UPI00298D1859|nr:DUF1236 domain-containing protein [Mesorhizobium sp. BAC0120]MDW6022132.1 DUF1236 domain-containing protein [Mesorhizobium sp. BAC0120]